MKKKDKSKKRPGPPPKEIKPDPNEPQYMDIVKNKLTNVTGTVIAKYPGLDIEGKNGVNFIDVRIDSEERIWYESPVRRWEVLKKYSTEEEGK